MIDLHCHILPGMDDGPKDLEESLAMARMAVADGIRHMVVTPHVKNDTYPNTRETILKRLQWFKEALGEQGIPLALYPGSDIHLEPDILERVEAGELLPVNGRKYLLLELPSQTIPSSIKEILFALRVKGYYPVITHPERNPTLQKHPHLLGEWIEQGALVQVTAGSLHGLFGSRAYHFSVFLLARGWAHLIASDGHSSQWRPPVLTEGLKQAAEIIGPQPVRKMVMDHAELVLTGLPIPEEDLHQPPPPRPVKRHFLSRFFRPPGRHRLQGNGATNHS